MRRPLGGVCNGVVLVDRPMNAWFDDPLERARFVDGEGSPSERAEREADLARDRGARARVEAQAAFLSVIRSAASVQSAPSDLLETRIRRALAADRAAGFPSTGAGDS